MKRAKPHRRVTYTVRRCRDGWLPVVLIGEEPVTLAVQPSKALARDKARHRASAMREAGAG